MKEKHVLFKRWGVVTGWSVQCRLDQGRSQCHPCTVTASVGRLSCGNQTVHVDTSVSALDICALARRAHDSHHASCRYACSTAYTMSANSYLMSSTFRPDDVVTKSLPSAARLSAGIRSGAAATLRHIAKLCPTASRRDKGRSNERLTGS